ncbi:MAG TPA: thioredoxin domain-containing protein [Bryobacteraceae bacterium]|nr:thioredoxin domain-containing protein [Bryobacteraceae bacterium]
MATNRLAREKSPYLLQHANNPVDWYPWGEEAFEKARREDKPIFLSIGYSTCHWCHVMEHESFESPEIAEVLNRNFVPIKVDREERPDVDRLYMTFVQASTGSGGWPMSVWLTPELKPFFGGTYFPPDNRYGRPGFRHVLESLAGSWASERDRMVDSGNQVLQQLEQMSRVAARGKRSLDKGLLDSAYFPFRRSYDATYGGFGGAPKFPRPSAFNFLLRYGHLRDNDEAIEMVIHTLRSMARGGMNDQLAGGFHRYSVDQRWFVPHFEKMLYDQAQLAVSYLEAFQISGDESLSATARRTLDYVVRDMTDAEGGFYSAEDADSVIDPSNPREKGEGAFYIWSAAELRDLLGTPTADIFAYRFGVEENGNVKPHEDPHGEFTGKNILFEQHTIAETAERFNLPEPDVKSLFADAEAKLMDARSGRIRPHLDDKILTSWNALMISAFALGARVLEEPKYLEAARRAVQFLRRAMYRDGKLLRRFREGDAAIEGFLDDYAFLVKALLDMYQADFDPAHLKLAIELSESMIERFGDPVGGGFFSSVEGDPSLVLRMKEDYDGAEPSGNSIAVLNLIRLHELTGEERYRELADHTLQAFATRLHEGASGVPQMLVGLLAYQTPPRQIILAGPSDEAFLHQLNQRFLPRHTVISLEQDEVRQLLQRGHPELAEMRAIEGETTAYVCENFACQLPTTDVQKFAELLS